MRDTTSLKDLATQADLFLPLQLAMSNSKRCAKHDVGIIWLNQHTVNFEFILFEAVFGE